MREGRVLKALGGYFFVHDFESKEVYRCTIRGRLKKEDCDVVTGDLVKFDLLDDGSGVVEERLERKNSLFRPVIANIDQVIITFAILEPDLDFKLLDRLLVLAEVADLEVTICINKVELASLEVAKKRLLPYQKVGYRVIYTSVKEELGLNALKEVLKDNVSVFAGPSGVGKSSLLNAIQPGLELKVGEVSQRIKRGRHTTRHVELLSLDNQGWVADTPGFSSLDLSFITTEKLQYFFPEFINYLGQCKFSPCSHSHEPQCAVKEAVAVEEIATHRYQNYLQFLEEVENKKRGW
ncbi:ribosome small subunit-dependent GTPase A [Natroniella sulfidigena]|uniref:ribosome small subunit-dependent GTPase A n=1 Tax=Natroniella sulfidigena TaxID=723921 RepID=UPI002009E311|nr:ribosome small subunit-dependent GTPase A [Natroniella sulfidigena]MCK8817813.1 ribosome small subunit-dependent GTPase A [Natroniella sulfidigena]